MATTRIAACACGQLRVACTGDPVRVSVCHCLDCQKRSGSSFAAQARWQVADVAITGISHHLDRPGENGTMRFHFCPDCGGGLYYLPAGDPNGLVAVAVGGFADPSFPQPDYSVYEGRKHRWVAITGDGIDHYD
ncbi:GFA family protein [Sphingomonas sp. BN140010]|uniref:GFA family protein n=1 Tax=Sphingomonas arvum TaxID=2992113 RepID=A0ABT3JB42_9SPHN|nr:GFA family protein [Sphingomonas sp. BN140010]MCW3796293.1 GFA family protein [Sphingomonas sp. BN140010]